MSTDYYASFSPVPLSRMELAKKLESIPFSDNCSINFTIDKLTFDGDRYQYTYEDEEVKDFISAISLSENWDGVEIHFTREKHMCSFLIWNDGENVVLTYCEPGSLFDQECSFINSRLMLGVYLHKIMNAIGAEYCIYEAESTFATRTEHDIRNWISDITHSQNNRYWELIICKDDTISAQLINSTVRDLGFFYTNFDEKHRDSANKNSAWLMSFMGEIPYIL